MSNRKQTGISTPTKSTIYDYDNRIDRTWSIIRKETSKNNQDIIERYDNLMITSSMAKATRHKHLQTILNLTRFLDKDWNESSSHDISKLVVEIVRRYANDNGQETYTSYDHKKILKIFYRWFKLGSREFKEVGDPPETKSVKIKTPTDRLSREDLLTDNDLERILRACGENQRDRAFIDVHSEAGTRPGEILSLSIKHVVFDEYGAIIKVDGKTGPRPIRLIRSVPNLSSWINTHPMRDNPDAPLWINTSPKKFGEPLSYSASRQMLARRCEIAELPKKINMKLFRHSEATESANFMTEAQLRKRHGWSNSSKMPARYVHMINADVENAILDHYGIKRQEDENQAELPKICHICNIPNAFDSKICSKCGKPLDLETALTKEEEQKTKYSNLEKDFEEFKEEMKSIIKEIREKENS
ncbi:MAG: tyrosine-type recombinase/integrase [Nitrosopumilus sp.]